LTHDFPTYSKTHSSKVRFFEHWNKLDEAQRKVAFPDEKKLTQALSDIASLGQQIKDNKEAE
jgi:hypothetical protein